MNIKPVTLFEGKLSPGKKEIANLSKYNLIIVEVQPTNAGRQSVLVFKGVETFITDDSGYSSTHTIKYIDNNVVFTALPNNYYIGYLFKIIGIY